MDNQYYCNRCDREFQNFNAIKSHYSDSHKKTLHYACSTCYQCFETEAALATHRRNNPGAAPHQREPKAT
ncbi:unnamed protein product [Linum trigynum]|uniref:C2H2-type domain-containing protein n=1 Tax=Linum trigynum TaxID=586398 RepID=A0AAV2FZK4_9ROSI